MNWIDRPIEPPKARQRGIRWARYQTNEERLAGRERSRARAYEKLKETLASAAHGRKLASVNDPPRPRVPPDVLADAERIKYLEHESLTGRLMGDPLPGRSALDKSRSGT